MAEFTEDTAMYHIVLPVFHACVHKNSTRELAISAFCKNFLHDINEDLTRPSTIYVSLFLHSDKDVEQI